MNSLLPDREHRHLLQFYALPSCDYGKRLFLAGGMIVLGFIIQILFADSNLSQALVLSLPLLLLGNIFLLVKGYDLKPSYGMSSGNWEKTTRDRFQKVRELQEEVARWDIAFADVTCIAGGVVILLLLALVGLVTVAFASNRETSNLAPILALNVVVLLVPHWITGTRRGWRPVALREEIDALEVALNAIDKFDEPPCQIQPMFQVAGKADNRTPIGARVFIRFPDGPEGFLGLQYQVSINDVQGTKYPYLYAVLVAKKGFGLLGEPLDICRKRFHTKEEPGGFLSFLGLTPAKDKITVESSSEKDVDVIIIRQHTTKQSGYHTNPGVIEQIARSTWEIAGGLASLRPVLVTP